MGTPGQGTARPALAADKKQRTASEISVITAFEPINGKLRTFELELS
jgi:hypothetical protein